MHLSTKETAASRMLESFGKVGGYVPKNFHCEHILLRLKIKSYCEKLVLKTEQLEFRGFCRYAVSPNLTYWLIQTSRGRDT